MSRTIMSTSLFRTCRTAAVIGWLACTPVPARTLIAAENLPRQLLLSVSGGPDLESPAAVRRVRDILTEREDDAVEARALFMQGQLFLERREFGDALRCYERAWRFDPILVSAIHEIVPRAISLNREAEATRYAIIASESENDVPPALVESVVAILARRLDFQRALHIYQRFAEQQSKSSDPFTRLLVQFEIGRLSLLTGKFDQAAAAFAVVRAALAQDDADKLSATDRKKLLPKPEAAYVLMGEAFLRAKRFADAEALFRLADQAKPNAGLLAYHLARIEAARGQADTALKNLEKYFDAKLAIAGTDPYLLLANLLAKTGPTAPMQEPDTTPAKPSIALLDKLKEMATADPDNAALAYFYAEQLRRADKLQLAEHQYQKLLKTKPAVEAYQGLVDIFVQQKQVDLLLKTLGQVVMQTASLDELGPVVQQIISIPKLRAQLVERAESGKKSADRPAPEGAVRACAMLQLEAADYASADRLFQVAMKQNEPRQDAFAIEFALLMMAAGKPTPAINALRQVIDEKRMADKQAELYHALAGAYAMADRFDEALQAARTAAAEEPESPRMFARAGWVNYYAKKLEPAEARFLQLLDRFDDDYQSEETRLVLRDVRQMLSSICVDKGRPQDAEAWLQQILDEYPEDVGAANDLGYLWCDQGVHLNRALEMIRRAVDAEPDNIAYRDSLGWALFRTGRYQQAVSELEKAVTADPDGVILDHLGDAYEKAGKSDKAVATWKKAVERLDQAGDKEKATRIRAKLNKQTGCTGPKERR